MSFDLVKSGESEMMQKKDKALLALLIVVLFAASGLFSYTFFRNFSASRGKSPAVSEDVNKLIIPPLLEDHNPDPDVSDFVIDILEGTSEFFPGTETATLGYNGSYLGPVMRVKNGQKVNIQANNHLAMPTTLHWHGLIVEGEQDGGPHQGILPGESWTPSFIIDQPAATLWFHPHFVHTTANQVYDGLAGLIIIDDDLSDSLDLPDEYGINDIPLIVQDRNFRQDGNFDYQTTMMGVVDGDVLLINGTVNPYIVVEHEKIRLRLLNGSNARNYVFRLDDNSAFLQIASDGGFLSSPAQMTELFLSPGERAEIILDFTASNKQAGALMASSRKVLSFFIDDGLVPSPAIPESLTEIPLIPLEEDAIIRTFDLQGMGISGTINGKSFDMNRIDEVISLNQTEKWVVRNVGGMMQDGGHPFHVHGTQFQVISRNGQPPPPGELGYKDTVYVDVGEEVVIQIQFKRTGLFMYHCHILEHEDRGMMGQFQVK